MCNAMAIHYQNMGFEYICVHVCMHALLLDRDAVFAVPHAELVEEHRAVVVGVDVVECDLALRDVHLQAELAAAATELSEIDAPVLAQVDVVEGSPQSVEHDRVAQQRGELAPSHLLLQLVAACSCDERSFLQRCALVRALGGNSAPRTPGPARKT